MSPAPRKKAPTSAHDRAGRRLKEGELKPKEVPTKAPRARKPREAQGSLFPAVKGEIDYGAAAREPVLYRALESVVKEADANGGVSSWRSTNGKPVTQIRSAAARWGYRVNTSTARLGGVEVTTVFRLNGKLEGAS